MASENETQPGSPRISTVQDAQISLRKVRDLGVTWLLAHIDGDGKPDDSETRNGWYRLPWTLAYVGEREVASKVMSWIEREALSDEGDLLEGGPRNQFVTKCCTYPLSLISQGAWSLERYDTALRVMGSIRGLINWDTGGAYWERLEARQTRRQYIYPTAQVGLAAIMTGQRDIADAAFGWLERLWKSQPALPNVLYASWGPEGLVTSPGEGDIFACRVDFSKPLQAFYNPGIAASFLFRYFMATGNEYSRTMGLEMLKLNMNGTKSQFSYWESMQICKFGWGSALAHEVDSDQVHLDNLIRMAQWYCDSQAADGTWVPSGFLEPNPQVSDAMTKTAEHVLWVSMMLASLSGGQPRNRD